MWYDKPSTATVVSAAAETEAQVTMATVDDLRSQLADLTSKYGRSETNLRQLKQLADRAVDDYDSLKRKYAENQIQNKFLQEKLTESEARRKNIENVLEPAVEEYGHLQKQYDIEKCCRSQAEIYASKLKRQNKELKRQSQALLLNLKLQPIDIDFNEPDTSMDVSEDDRDLLNRKIQSLEERNKELEEALESEEKLKLTFHERETYLTNRIQESERKLKVTEEKVTELENHLKKYTRVSQMIWQEYQEMKDKHENEVRLKFEAERYAHEKMSERDAVIRESSILLTTASADKRLASAFMAIEDLTKKLELERLNHQKEVLELKEGLRQFETSSQFKAMEDVESRLQVAVEESERLIRTVQNMENQIDQLKTENRELLSKLEVCEERLKPLPPPPAPPLPSATPRFSPLRIFMRKKTKTEDNSQSPMKTEESSRDKTYEEALKEMMDRIKSGQALKAAPVKQTTCAPKEEEEGSAMNDLHRLLGSLKSRQRTTGDGAEGEDRLTPAASAAAAVDDGKAWQSRRQLLRPQRAATVDTPMTRDNELLRAFKARGKPFDETV